MTSRGRMTMRADVERDTASGTDAYGGPVKPTFTTLATIPCFIYSKTRREIVDGDKSALVEDLRALFALDADIAEGDEIAAITGRLGVTTMTGRFQIEAIQRKHRHLEASLLRVQ